MSEPLITRARGLARKPPRYIAWRLAAEVRRRADRRQITAARSGGGRLALDRIVPGGLNAALEQTVVSASTIGRWVEAGRVTQRNPLLRADLERRAARALQRVMPLFGDEAVAVGVPPAWNEDPCSRFTWPESFHAGIDYVNRGEPSDVKNVWELSRLRHCVALAQASTVLDDPAALIAIEEDIDDWIGRNPMGFTVNWTVGMEVALRALNLICVDGILSAHGERQHGRDRMVASLYQHGWFLFRNLEVSDCNGNHYLACALGLVWLGRYFGHIGEGPRWYRRGVRMVETAATEQILPGGVDHEGSLPYHLLVVEMFLLALVAAPRDLAGIEPEIRAMLETAERVVAPTGEIPDLGDDDGGRVAAFCDAPSRDARRVLALGSAVLGKPLAVADPAAWPQDALWLTGTGEIRAAPRSGPPLHLDHGGLVVLGRGDDHVVVDVGPVGFRGRGGHGHLDAMSFVAWLGGMQVIRDSGTGSYTGDAVTRNLLRDVFAHNTVVLDERPYARLGDERHLWLVEGDSPPRDVAVGDDVAAQWVCARQELPCAAGRGTFARLLRWTPGVVSWTDTVDAPPGTLIRQLTQLPRGVRPVADGFESGAIRYRIRAPADATLHSATVPCSDRYGSVSEAPRAELTLQASGGTCTIEWTVSRA